MRKKDIFGHYIRRVNANVECRMRQVSDDPGRYSALIHFLDGNKELVVTEYDTTVCIAGDGHTWLVLLPLKEYWSMTAMYNERMEIVEWYFDINKSNFLDESGIPCGDDLYLDLVLLPDGRRIMLDEDELLEAMKQQEITKEDVDFAFDVYHRLSESKWTDPQYLTAYCKQLLAEYE
jgi:predicted RNA-binding protein associated with RNAse of E/G family